LDNMGVKRPLLPENKEMFEKTSRRMGEKGLRPILLAYTQVDAETSEAEIQKNPQSISIKESSSLP